MYSVKVSGLIFWGATVGYRLFPIKFSPLANILCSWFVCDLCEKSLLVNRWLGYKPLNNHKRTYFHMYSYIHYSKWREKNQFHASGCFCEAMWFLTCSVPPWALHLEDCKPSPVSGKPGMEWGALVPRGLARLWTETASPLSSHWSHSEYGDWGRLVTTMSPLNYLTVIMVPKWLL